MNTNGWRAESMPAQEAGYRLWVNLDSTILVRIWDEGFAEIAFRDHRSHTWGPPKTLVEEQA